MDDNKNQNQSNQAATDYQKILDEYAASVKPEDVNPSSETQKPEVDLNITTSLKEAPAKLEENKIPEVNQDITENISFKPTETYLKGINSPQIESPIHPSLAANLEIDEPTPTPVKEIPVEITPEPVKTTQTTPILETPNLPPEKSPEEIKAEINRLLEDDKKPQDYSDPVAPKKSGAGRVFFVFALILFLAVAAGLAYFLFLSPLNSNNSNSNSTNNSVTPTVTETENPIDTNGTCELNNKSYAIGESFASADGCNTCSCQSAGVIVCTEMACSGTPAVTSATKSATVTSVATKSTIPTGWKTYTSKDFKFSISLPSDWKLVFPGDGSLDTNPLTDKSFDDNGAGGLLTTVSSPDKKQEINLMDTLDISMSTTKCTSNISTINTQQVKKTTCPGVDNNAVPGPVNYEFVGKGLYVITSPSTTTIDSIIKSIKFN